MVAILPGSRIGRAIAKIYKNILIGGSNFFIRRQIRRVGSSDVLTHCQLFTKLHGALQTRHSSLTLADHCWPASIWPNCQSHFDQSGQRTDSHINLTAQQWNLLGLKSFWQERSLTSMKISFSPLIMRLSRTAEECARLGMNCLLQSRFARRHTLCVPQWNGQGVIHLSNYRQYRQIDKFAVKGSQP